MSTMSTLQTALNNFINILWFPLVINREILQYSDNNNHHNGPFCVVAHALSVRKNTNS